MTSVVSERFGGSKALAFAFARAACGQCGSKNGTVGTSVLSNKFGGSNCFARSGAGAATLEIPFPSGSATSGAESVLVDKFGGSNSRWTSAALAGRGISIEENGIVATSTESSRFGGSKLFAFSGPRFSEAITGARKISAISYNVTFAFAFAFAGC